MLCAEKCNIKNDNIMEGLEYNYITGYPSDVLEHLDRSLSQYMAHYSMVKVGITGNPERRWGEHHSDGWERMVVKYETSSENFVNQMEDYFIATRPSLANIWTGTSHLAGARKFYLYFIMQ